MGSGQIHAERHRQSPRLGLRSKISELSRKEDAYRKKLGDREGLEEQIRNKNDIIAGLESLRRESEAIEETISRLKLEEQQSEETIGELEKRAREEKAKARSIQIEVAKAEALYDEAEKEMLKERDKRDELAREFRTVLADREALKEESVLLAADTADCEEQIRSLRQQIQDQKNAEKDNARMVSELKAGIEREQKKMDDSISLVNSYRTEYVTKLKGFNVQFKDYQILMEEYRKEQDYYGNIISGFLNDSLLGEGWDLVTDDDLRKSLKARKEELDRMLREEMRALSGLLRKYDID